MVRADKTNGYRNWWLRVVPCAHPRLHQHSLHWWLIRSGPVQELASKALRTRGPLWLAGTGLGNRNWWYWSSTWAPAAPPNTHWGSTGLAVRLWAGGERRGIRKATLCSRPSPRPGEGKGRNQPPATAPGAGRHVRAGPLLESTSHQKYSYVA